MLKFRIAILTLLALTAACSESPPPAPPVASPDDLAAHSAEFERGVIEVTDGVHVAIGFGLAKHRLANQLVCNTPNGFRISPQSPSSANLPGGDGRQPKLHSRRGFHPARTCKGKSPTPASIPE